MAVIDNVHTAVRRRVATQRGIDELRDQCDQRSAHIAYRKKQRRARPVRIPEVVTAHRRNTARNVEPAAAKLPALRAVRFEELDALVHGLDFEQLARRDAGIENIEPIIVGEEKRRLAAGPRRRKGAAAAAAVRSRRRQVPQRQSREPGARTDQQGFLDLAQGDRRVRRFVAEGPLGHLEAEAEPPRAAAIESLEQRVIPGQVQQFGRRHQHDPCKIRDARGTGRS